MAQFGTLEHSQQWSCNTGCLIEGDNETLVSVLCCFHCGSLPKACLAPGRALSWLLDVMKTTAATSFSGTLSGYFSLGACLAALQKHEAWSNDSLQHALCFVPAWTCRRGFERGIRVKALTRVLQSCGDWWQWLKPLPQQWAARGCSHSCEAQADWHRATGLSWKVWGAQA